MPDEIQSTTPETQESTEAVETKETSAAPTKEEVKAVEKQLKKIKLKVDGKEFEEEYDPNDEEYLRRQFQLAKMGQSRAQYSSTLEKEIGQFMQDLKNNPKSILSDPSIGVDLKKFAAEILNEAAEEAKKTPEQKEKEAMAAELKALKEEREKEKDESRKKDMERLEASELSRYNNDINDALDGTDLPKSPYVVRKMADYLLIGLQNGKALTAKDVLPLVKEEIQNDIKQMFATAPDEMVEQFLGKERLTNYRKKNLAKAKEAPIPVKSIKDVAKATDGEKPSKKINYKQFFGA